MDKDMVRTGGLLLDTGMFIWRGEGGREEIILFMLYQLKMLRMILKVNLLFYLTKKKKNTEQTMSHLDLYMVHTGTQITSRIKLPFHYLLQA